MAQAASAKADDLQSRRRPGVACRRRCARRVGTAVWLLAAPTASGGLDARAGTWVVRFRLMAARQPESRRGETPSFATSVGPRDARPASYPFIGCIPPRAACGRRPGSEASRGRSSSAPARSSASSGRRDPAAERPRRPRLQQGQRLVELIASGTTRRPSDPAAAREGAPDDQADQGTRLITATRSDSAPRISGPGADPRPCTGSSHEVFEWLIALVAPSGSRSRCRLRARRAAPCPLRHPLHEPDARLGVAEERTAQKRRFIPPLVRARGRRRADRIARGLRATCPASRRLWSL